MNGLRWSLRFLACVFFFAGLLSVLGGISLVVFGEIPNDETPAILGAFWRGALVLAIGAAIFFLSTLIKRG